MLRIEATAGGLMRAPRAFARSHVRQGVAAGRRPLVARWRAVLAEFPRSARPALSLATQVISTQWHGTHNLPTKIAEPNKITAFTYANANATTGMGAGNLTGRSETTTTDATGAAKFAATQAAGTPIKSTGWSYNSTSSLPTTIVERETGFGGTTATETGKWTYAYNSAGDINKVSNAAIIPNQVATLSSYSTHGQPLAGKGMDGRTFTLNYRLDNQISKLSFSDGYLVNYVYNSKNQLVEARASDGGLATLEYGTDGRPTRYIINGQVLLGAAMSAAQKSSVQSAGAASAGSTIRPVPMPEIDWSGMGRGAGRIAAACAARAAAILMAVLPDTAREESCADDPRQERPECKKDPCAGLRRQIAIHEEKLRLYIANPLSQDNKGFLAAALANNDMDLYNTIYLARIASLQAQIANFKKQLEECEKRNAR
jgi:hypothetical protein